MSTWPCSWRAERHKRPVRGRTFFTLYKEPSKFLKEMLLCVRSNVLYSHSVSHRVLMVLGAGRGPLVNASLRAARQADRKLRVYAVEKNPNAVVTYVQYYSSFFCCCFFNDILNILFNLWHFSRLENWRFEEWGEQVTVVSCDMREWAAPEKADIIVSELLGSFGDNELSPECLDGAQHFLKGKHHQCVSCDREGGDGLCSRTVGSLCPCGAFFTDLFLYKSKTSDCYLISQFMWRVINLFIVLISVSELLQLYQRSRVYCQQEKQMWLLWSFRVNEALRSFHAYLHPISLSSSLRLIMSPSDGGVSIPSSYTSFLAPLSSSKLYNEVRGCRERDKDPECHFETPYVVRLHNFHQLAEPKACFTFKHPTDGKQQWRQYKIKTRSLCDVAVVEKPLLPHFQIWTTTGTSVSDSPRAVTLCSTALLDTLKPHCSRMSHLVSQRQRRRRKSNCCPDVLSDFMFSFLSNSVYIRYKTRYTFTWNVLLVPHPVSSQSE